MDMSSTDGPRVRPNFYHWLGKDGDIRYSDLYHIELEWNGERLRTWVPKPYTVAGARIIGALERW